MKFSDIVKNRDSGLAVARPPQKPDTPASKPLPVQPPSQQGPSEQELQAKLEKEFREKLAQIELENKRLTEDQKKQEQSQQSLRDKLFQEEQQKLQELMKDLQKSREEVSSMRLALENEMKHKFESEKARVEAERRNEQALYQKKIAEMEDRLKKNELSPKTETVISQESKNVIQPQASPASPMTEAVLPAASPEKTEHGSKYLPPRPKTPSAFQTTMVTETDTYRENPAVEAEVRGIYFDIVKHSADLFRQIQQHEKFDLQKLQERLSSLVSIAMENDSELIRIALEPYPEKKYFPYHAANSAVLAIVLGLDSKLNKDQLSNLALAGVLHDIGLVSIQESLDYPKELSEEVKQEVIQHPLKGSEMLAGLVAPEVQTAIAQHHEACNGKGYPQELDEQSICLEAKILQVVDAFEAMTHQRAYRAKPLEVNQAVKEIIEKGRLFYDREVMKALMGRIGLYPVNTMVTLSSKQVARVLRQNSKFPMSPVIRVEFDEFGNKLKTPFVIDLVKNQLIHVIDPISDVPSYSHSRIHRHRKPDGKAAKTILAEVLPYALIVLIGGLLVYLVLKI